MKKIVLSCLALAGFVAVNAQDLKKAETQYMLYRGGQKGALEKSKSEIDKVFNIDAASIDGLLLHARIYGALSYDDNAKAKYPTALNIANQSFEKYLAQDTDAKKLADSKDLGLVDNLYAGNFNKAIMFGQDKNPDSASVYSKKAAQIGALITKYNWKSNNQVIDTFSVLNTAIYLDQSKKMDEAVKYYGQLIDAKVGGEANFFIYEQVLFHLYNTKNKTDFDKYLGIARNVYPDSTNRWNDYQRQYAYKNFSMEDKIEAFKKEDAAGTMTYDDYFNYGVTFSDEAENKDNALTPDQVKDFAALSADAYKKAYGKDATRYEAPYNLGYYLYGVWVDLDDRKSANIAEIQQLNKKITAEVNATKKAALKKQLQPQIDNLKTANVNIDKEQLKVGAEAATWLENSYKTFEPRKASLTPQEKRIALSCAERLSFVYEFLRDKNKLNQKDYDAYDAKFKTYEALRKSLKENQ